MDLDLDLDLGTLWGKRESSPFRVRLRASAFGVLLDDAKRGNRLYELWLIHRPGDVWRYVEVEVLDASVGLAARLDTRSRLGPQHHRTLSLAEFERRLLGDVEGDADDGLWRRARDGDAVTGFAQQLFEVAQAQLRRSRELDQVARHEHTRIESGRHPYHFRSVEQVLAQGAECAPPFETRHGASFLAKLQQLLGLPELRSVAFRGEADYACLRLMCNEQRRRADAAGLPPGRALALCAATHLVIDNLAWDSELWFHEEGLGEGDLCVEGGGRYGWPVAALLTSGMREFGPHILSRHDEGPLPGYERRVGDGWTHYVRVGPSPAG